MPMPARSFALAALAAIAFAPVEAPALDDTLKPIVEAFLQQQATFTIDLGQMFVCEPAATLPRVFADRVMRLTGPESKYRAMYESDYRRHYLPLRGLGLVDISDGPPLSGSPFVWAWLPRPAPPRRSIPCKHGKYVVARAGPKAVPIARETRPDDTHLVAEAGRPSLTRIVRDETMELKARYRIVELEYIAVWNPLYLQAMKVTGRIVPKANRKAVLILMLDPRGGAPMEIGRDVADAGQPYKRITNARSFVLLRQHRARIVY